MNEDLRDKKKAIDPKRRVICEKKQKKKKKEVRKKTSTKIETKFAAFGIRLDAEPMMRTTFAFLPERDNVTPCIPDLTPIYPKRDTTYILLSKIYVETEWAGLRGEEKKNKNKI